MGSKPDKTERTIRPPCTSDPTQGREGRRLVDVPLTVMQPKDSSSKSLVVWKPKSALRGVPCLPE